MNNNNKPYKKLEDASPADVFKIPKTPASNRRLSKKNKNLIQLSIAVILRCDKLIVENVDQALRAGASKLEIKQAINTAINMISLSGAAPSMIYSQQVKEYLQKHCR